MSTLGSESRPLRVAIVGSGPSGFYAAEALTRGEVNVIVDMFDKLPAPYGLVRYGVAPDHAKIKSVTKVYEKTAAKEQVSFLLNVNIGVDISVGREKNVACRNSHSYSVSNWSTLCCPPCRGR